MDKIIITGATGYIGSQICKSFVNDGYQVAIIVRPSSDVSILGETAKRITIFADDGDITKLVDFFTEYNAAAVIHLASCYITAHTTVQVDTLVESNIRFAAHIMEAASRSGVKHFINTSTSWQYYNNEPHRYACLYAATKQMAEELLAFYADAYEMHAVNLTIYDSYGCNDPRKKIMSLFAAKAESGDVLKMSGGEQTMELVYIDDIVRAYRYTYDNIEELVERGKTRSYFYMQTNRLA